MSNLGPRGTAHGCGAENPCADGRGICERGRDPAGWASSEHYGYLIEPASQANQTPSLGSASTERGHSIPIGDGAVGPSRSGFVQQGCTRTAETACDEARVCGGPSGTTFFVMWCTT